MVLSAVNVRDWSGYLGQSPQQLQLGSQLLTNPAIVFSLDDERGQLSSNNGYTGVICNITDRTLYSKLTFNFSDNISVNCQDNFGARDNVILSREHVGDQSFSAQNICALIHVAPIDS